MDSELRGTMTAQGHENRHLTFLDLSPEIRNNIYHLIHADQCIIGAVRIKSPKYHDDFPFPITRANRQIRSETLGLFYGSQPFSFFVARNGRSDTSTAWVEAACEDTILSLREITVWSHCVCLDRDLPIPVAVTFTLDTDGDGQVDMGPRGIVDSVWNRIQDVFGGLEKVDGRVVMTKLALRKIFRLMRTYV